MKIYKLPPVALSLLLLLSLPGQAAPPPPPPGGAPGVGAPPGV